MRGARCRARWGRRRQARAPDRVRSRWLGGAGWSPLGHASLDRGRGRLMSRCRCSAVCATQSRTWRSTYSMALSGFSAWCPSASAPASSRTTPPGRAPVSHAQPAGRAWTCPLHPCRRSVPRRLCRCRRPGHRGEGSAGRRSSAARRSGPRTRRPATPAATTGSVQEFHARCVPRRHRARVCRSPRARLGCRWEDCGEDVVGDDTPPRGTLPLAGDDQHAGGRPLAQAVDQLQRQALLLS